MSKYSSDSNSSGDRRRKKKHKRRSRSSSPSSDDSRYSSRKKHSRSKRSRERRSRSRDKYKSRRDGSRDRSSRSGHSSRSSSTVKKRVSSRDKSSERNRTRRRSRSVSRERSKRRSRSSSSSRSPRSLDSTTQTRTSRRELVAEEQLKTKLEQAVKAAQLANNLLHQQGLISGAVAQKTSIIKTPSLSVLDEINKPGFASKPFTSQSSYSYTPQSFPSDDLSKILSGAPKMSVLAVEVKEGPASVFHPCLMVDPEQKLAKWAKKLYQIRQKALHGDPLT